MVDRDHAGLERMSNSSHRLGRAAPSIVCETKRKAISLQNGILESSEGVDHCQGAEGFDVHHLGGDVYLGELRGCEIVARRVDALVNIGIVKDDHRRVPAQFYQRAFIVSANDEAVDESALICFPATNTRSTRAAGLENT